MNTNKQWSYEEDQQLFEYIWNHSKYPNSTTMHSQRAIKEFTATWWNLTNVIPRSTTGIGIRLKLYTNFINKAYPNKTWSKIDFIPEFRTWHYKTFNKNSSKGLVLTTEMSKKEQSKQDNKIPVYVVKDKVYDVIKTNDWQCDLCDFDKGGECIKQPIYCKSSYMLANYGFKFGYYKLRKENPNMETPKTIECLGKTYQFETKSSGWDCRNCEIPKIHYPDASLSCPTRIGFVCTTSSCGGMGRWVLVKDPKSNTPKPFTIDDVPKNCIITYRNGNTFFKYGDNIIAANGSTFLSSEMFSSRRLPNLMAKDRDKSSLDIISVKELSIGKELMSQPTLKYSVVDTEDNILHTLISTKELHLVKE